MSNTLLFHIGRAKTGTTALQTFLYENDKKLEEYGWYYPNLKHEFPEIQVWPNAIAKNGDILYQEWHKLDGQNKNWEKVWEYLLKVLEDKNVIISNESFLLGDTVGFLTEAKNIYSNIKVVVYLRRQDRALESSWNQHIKVLPGTQLLFCDWIESEKGVAKELYYYNKLEQISNVIGKENIIVRVYESQQFAGTEHTIESDFLSILGIEPDWSKWKKGRILNTRLSGNYLEMKRVVNSLGIAVNEEIIKYSRMFRELSQVFSKDKEDEGYFTTEERKNFMKQFALENEKIARDYLDREDGILFYDDRMDYPLYECECSSFEADLIRIFMTIIYRMDERVERCEREIQQLRKQNLILTLDVLLYKANGRKLMYFGAGKKCRELLETAKLPVQLIADNDREKDGNKIGGIEIVWAGSIKEWDEFLIIVTCVETDMIERQLQQNGLKKEENYVLAKEYFGYC